MKVSYLIFPALLTFATACSHKPLSDGRVNEKVIGLSRSEQVTYTGQPVAFNNVKVQRVTNDQEIWVGPNAQETIAIVLDASDPRYSRRFDVREGDTISVTGVLRQAQTGPAAVSVVASDMRKKRAE